MYLSYLYFWFTKKVLKFAIKGFISRGFFSDRILYHEIRFFSQISLFTLFMFLLSFTQKVLKFVIRGVQYIYFMCSPQQTKCTLQCPFNLSCICFDRPNVARSAVKKTYQLDMDFDYQYEIKMPELSVIDTEEFMAPVERPKLR